MGFNCAIIDPDAHSVNSVLRIVPLRTFLLDIDVVFSDVDLNHNVAAFYR